MWLERCGQANFDNLVETYEVTQAATLSPVRAVPAATVRSAATACQEGGSTPTPTPTTPAAPADTRAGEEEAAGNDAGVQATNQAAPDSPTNAARSKPRRGGAVGAVAAAATVAAAALLLP
jgi:septal ring-binding cell division protein DamX